jgi:hypothetical protein
VAGAGGGSGAEKRSAGLPVSGEWGRGRRDRGRPDLAGELRSAVRCPDIGISAHGYAVAAAKQVVRSSQPPLLRAYSYAFGDVIYCTWRHIKWLMAYGLWLIAYCITLR